MYIYIKGKARPLLSSLVFKGHTYSDDQPTKSSLKSVTTSLPGKNPRKPEEGLSALPSGNEIFTYKLPRVELYDLERIPVQREPDVIAGIAAHPELVAAHVVPVGPDPRVVRRRVALPARFPQWGGREGAAGLVPVLRVVAVELHVCEPEGWRLGDAWFGEENE